MNKRCCLGANKGDDRWANTCNSRMGWGGGAHDIVIRNRILPCFVALWGEFGSASYRQNKIYVELYQFQRCNLLEGKRTLKYG
jgi:hypothetical protein